MLRRRRDSLPGADRAKKPTALNTWKRSNIGEYAGAGFRISGA